jgi:hypothetical protein
MEVDQVAAIASCTDTSNTFLGLLEMQVSCRELLRFEKLHHHSIEAHMLKH